MMDLQIHVYQKIDRIIILNYEQICVKEKGEKETKIIDTIALLEGHLIS